jgi:hypothetical protein
MVRIYILTKTIKVINLNKFNLRFKKIWRSNKRQEVFLEVFQSHFRTPDLSREQISIHCTAIHGGEIKTTKQQASALIFFVHY